MRNTSLTIFLLFIFNSCSAQKHIIGKSYNYHYTGKINSSVLNNTVYFESDSTTIIYGGKGAYKYSSHPNYKILNDSMYYVYYPNVKRIMPSKKELKDTIMIKVQMTDVENDTIYWKNNKEFIFRERLFKLYEYKGVPLEDQ